MTSEELEEEEYRKWRLTRLHSRGSRMIREEEYEAKEKTKED